MAWVEGVGRRTFLKRALTGAAAAAVGLANRQVAAGGRRFPKDFIFGCSTSAFQIEGALNVDGRGPGIWDDIDGQPNRDAVVACDHYRRYREDVDLLGSLGVQAYRFSVSWPRVLPDGIGTVNPKGLSFYHRLIDCLLEVGIEPWLCLHHHDLPAGIQHRGGWTNPDIVQWFADYAGILGQAYGDRVHTWLAINEPSVVAYFGYGLGWMPIEQESGWTALKTALHHMNLAQAAAARVLRAIGPTGTRVGSALLMQPVRAALPGEEHTQAAHRIDALFNDCFMQPLGIGGYPEVFAEEMAEVAGADDLAAMAHALDFVGANYYHRFYVRHDPDGLLQAVLGDPPPGLRTNLAGSRVESDGMAEVAATMRRCFGKLPFYLTENGTVETAAEDRCGGDDANRIGYLTDHLRACCDLIAAGAMLRGYFIWTLIDCYEWGAGFGPKFGLVSLDRDTMARCPKQSFHWYRKIIDAREV